MRDRLGRGQLEPKDAHAGRLGRLTDPGDNPKRVHRMPGERLTQRTDSFE